MTVDVEQKLSFLYLAAICFSGPILTKQYISILLYTLLRMLFSQIDYNILENNNSDWYQDRQTDRQIWL